MSFYFLESESVQYQTLPLNTMLFSITNPGTTGLLFNVHNHVQLEINVLLRGSMDVTVEDRTYHLRPGDAVLCNPFALHSGIWTEPNAPGEFIGFTASLSVLLGYRDSPMFACCEALEAGKASFDEFYPAGESRVTEIIRGMLEVYTNTSGVNDSRTMMLFYELFSLLLEEHYHVHPNETSAKKDVHFAREISMFVKNNYQRDIGTSDAADALHMDLSRFCHTFKQTFGVPFRTHLCRYRCVRAAEYYRKTDISITDIASAVGFSDYCYFSRSFKKHIGVAPAVYFGKRKEHR